MRGIIGAVVLVAIALTAAMSAAKATEQLLYLECKSVGGKWDIIHHIKVDAANRIAIMNGYLKFEVSGMNDMIIEFGYNGPEEASIFSINRLTGELKHYAIRDSQTRETTYSCSRLAPKF